MKRFYLILFFLYSAVAFSQWSLEISSRVEKDGKGLPGAKITLLQGSKVITEMLSQADGDFIIDVPPNGDFVIQVSHEDCNPKKFQVFTRGVPPEVAADNFKPRYRIGGFTMKKPLYSIDYSALKNPMVKIVYFPDQGKFDHEEAHTELMLTSLGQIREAERILLEKHATVIKTGDAAFKKNDCVAAKANYESAVKLIPQLPYEEYPKSMIPKCDKCIADKENMGKEAAQKEADRIAKEKADNEKLAAEKALKEKLEAAEKLKKEQEAIVLKEKEVARKLEEEKAATEKAASDKLAKEKADADLQKKKEEDALALKQKAEEEKLNAEKALAEKAVSDKIAAEKAETAKKLKEAEALALKQKQEAEKLLAEKAEKEKNAKKQSESEKLIADKLAAEEAKKQKVIEEKAAKEKADAEKLSDLEKRKSEGTKLAEDRKKSESLAKEQAIAEKLASEKEAKERKVREKEKAKEVADRLSIDKKPKQKPATEEKKKEPEVVAAETKTSSFTPIVGKSGGSEQSGPATSGKSRTILPPVLGADKYREIVLRADDCFKMKRYEEAKVKYEEALVIKANDPHATNRLALIAKLTQPK